MPKKQSELQYSNRTPPLRQHATATKRWSGWLPRTANRLRLRTATRSDWPPGKTTKRRHRTFSGLLLVLANAEGIRKAPQLVHRLGIDQRDDRYPALVIELRQVTDQLPQRLVSGSIRVPQLRRFGDAEQPALGQLRQECGRHFDRRAQFDRCFGGAPRFLGIAMQQQQQL